MRRLLLATLTPLVLLAGCASTDSGATAPKAEDGLLAEHSLAGKDAVQIIDELDRLDLEERPTDLMASVQVDELVLSDTEDEVALELPEDRFYVSVAPYVTQTHECFYHSLTTCTGELGGEDVRVTVTDDTGKALYDEQTTTFDNGFVGIWLPRDVSGTIEVEYDGKRGEVDFGTGEEDPTCVTTLQLA